MALMESGTREVKGTGMGRGLASRLVEGGRQMAAVLLDQLYPPACACCGSPLATGHGLCAACFSRLLPITAPLCPVLGIPFDISPGDTAISAEALAE